MVPAALLAANATCSTIIGSTGSWFDLRDYLSVVFDEGPQTQLAASIPSESDITVTIDDEDELWEDPDKTITPADPGGDEGTVSVSVCASPVLCEPHGVSGAYCD